MGIEKMLLSLDYTPADAGVEVVLSFAGTWQALSLGINPELSNNHPSFICPMHLESDMTAAYAGLKAAPGGAAGIGAMLLSLDYKAAEAALSFAGTCQASGLGLNAGLSNNHPSSICPMHVESDILNAAHARAEGSTWRSSGDWKDAIEPGLQTR